MASLLLSREATSGARILRALEGLLFIVGGRSGLRGERRCEVAPRPGAAAAAAAEEEADGEDEPAAGASCSSCCC